MVRKHIDIIDDMLTLVGEIEALIAVGAFRAGRVYCIPVFTDIPEIQAKNSYHPLIEAPVKNDYRVDRGVLITGSNASGKSTFLKTAAINGILAQTSHTCMADSYRTGFFRICSSMALRDDIRSGNSYYMAEIKSLKRILDMLKQEGAPVLCFVDEVLRGTNTVERIAASTQILRSLAKTKGICFAATHDIELTYLLKEYDNYHFEESIEENDISFSYKLFKGPSSTRNAIKLLQVMGYDDRIVKEAEKMAADFLEKGSWTC
jgi:DNA mismatch repair ATPase MutS